MKHTLSLEIPAQSLSDQILAIQSTIIKNGITLDWVKPHHLSLQLNFLGSLTEAQLPIAFKQLNWLKSVSEFDLQFVYLDSLYHRHSPSEIFLTPANTPTLEHLFTQNSLHLAEANIPQPRRYLPRLVFAYTPRQDPTSTKRVLDQLSDINLPAPIDLHVDQVLAMEHLQSKKSTHLQKVATFRLLPATA